MTAREWSPIGRGRADARRWPGSRWPCVLDETFGRYSMTATRRRNPRRKRRSKSGHCPRGQTCDGPPRNHPSPRRPVPQEDPRPSRSARQPPPVASLDLQCSVATSLPRRRFVHVADDDHRAEIRQAARRPSGEVVVSTGCPARLAPLHQRAIIGQQDRTPGVVLRLRQHIRGHERRRRTSRPRSAPRWTANMSISTTPNSIRLASCP
jgi:hypothetical protein